MLLVVKGKTQMLKNSQLKYLFHIVFFLLIQTTNQNYQNKASLT